MKLLPVILSCMLALATWLGGGNLSAQNPTELLKAWENNFYGKSVEMEIRMTIIRPEWTRTAAAKIWTLGQDHALLLVKQPPKDAGTVYLKRGNDIWNYVPTLERTMKMPPGMLSQSWMGSDFAHDDLIRKSSILDDYSHRMAGSETLEGIACHVIELIPKEDAPVPYGKLRIWIGKSDGQQHKTEFYDEDDALVSTLRFGNIRSMGGRTIPTQLVMTPAGKKGWSTRLEYVSVNYTTQLTEAFFTQQNMTRVQ